MKIVAMPEFQSSRPASAGLPQATSGAAAGYDPASDAFTMLATEHEVIAAMLHDYGQDRREASQVAKRGSAMEICRLLVVHGAIEHEIFYPAAIVALGDEAELLLADAEAEHDALAAMIAEVERIAAGDACFDSKMADLADHAIAHFTWEEAELFPKLRAARFDAAGVGERLAQRRRAVSRRVRGRSDVPAHH